ncbi:conjugative transposon protein TraM [Terrimonas pollutisoli]|uniref:conjugative transposon protein TraM n=1 Tax=Terrimonas pollutisoli TaxID=3034147 RepID=UPI0023EC554B|nr:conjugative transposon protein TraM [Terrimonas sp. H1YJ31]
MKRMKSAERSQAFLRKRKMMLVMPLLVIPFLTMAFWAMGGGKGSDGSKPSVNNQGLNLNLPDANLKEDKVSDKLSFYYKADKDSMKLQEWMRSDPYYMKRDTILSKPVSNDLEQLTEKTTSKFNQRLNTSPYENKGNDPEQKIIQKLTLLEKELNKTTAVNDEMVNEKENGFDPAFSNEVDRLESMMGMMNKTDTDDPEMRQLDNTLNKILDIQHPERVKDRIREKSLQSKQQVFAVSKEPKEERISLLDTVEKKQDNETGFYGLNEESEANEGNNAIEAVVHENQTLVNGAVVKLRLLNDIYINGSLIPKGNFVFGITSLNDERLQIEINSIRCDQSLFTVKLEVYDMDGLPGIHIPGAITRDVAKQSADNGLQLMELSTMDPSFKAQAAAAGINAAKSLLSKKVKLVKVMVKAGYQVLLKDRNIQQ